MGNEVEKPNIKLKIIVMQRPTMMTGFRPIRSDTAPHATAVRPWQTENIAEVNPTHLATSFSLIPRLRIISGYWENLNKNIRNSSHDYVTY